MKEAKKKYVSTKQTLLWWRYLELTGTDKCVCNKKKKGATTMQNHKNKTRQKKIARENKKSNRVSWVAYLVRRHRWRRVKLKTPALRPHARRYARRRQGRWARIYRTLQQKKIH